MPSALDGFLRRTTFKYAATSLLYHINDQAEGVQSLVRLFADDCLLYHPIKSQSDHITLQNDLIELEKWADKWGMRFNAKKCYIMSINNRSTHLYSLNNHILKQVEENPYLGLTFTENLKWLSHITKITKKANSTIGFLRRNLKSCPQDSIYITCKISVGLWIHNLGPLSLT